MSEDIEYSLMGSDKSTIMNAIVQFHLFYKQQRASHTLFPIAGSEVTFHASPQAIPANSTPTGQEFRIWYQSSACASPTLLACTNTLHGRCNHQWQWNKAVEQAKTTTDNHANKLLSQRLN